MRAQFHVAVLMLLLVMLPGCLSTSEETLGGVGTYEVEATWTTVELETKTAFYADDEAVTWSVLDGELDQQIEDAGGHVVGLVLAMSYPTDNETPGGLCTGQENDVPDIVSGTATKGEWTLEASDSGFGGHEVNLTWHDQAILDAGVATNLSEQEVLDRFVFGEEARGTFDLTVLVDAQAHNSALCSHSDDGEEVTTVASLLVIDLTVTPAGMDDEGSSALTVGTGAIPSVIFAPVFIAMVALVAFVTRHQDRFQLRFVLEEEEEELEGESTSEGVTMTDSYRARVITLCALYVAQGIPWGFITVTFVTFLAARGVGASELALLLTLGTLPWSVKFLWGPVIDRYQIPAYGRRRPWILLAQTGMMLMLGAMLFVPDPTNNVRTIAIMFLIYNIFTSLQDVSTDALAVDVLQPHEVEKVNSYMFTSKTVGGAIGGAGLGTIIVFTGLKGAILLQIPILAGLMIAPMMMTERPGERRFPWEKRTEEGPQQEDVEAANQNFADIFAKIRTALSLRSAYLSIVLSLTVSLHFLLIPVLPLLFVRELGWTEAGFNATNGGWILALTVLGYLVGGQLGRRFGGKKIIIYAALGTAFVTALWGVSGQLWGSTVWMVGVWSLKNFGWSVVMINIYSLMMKVTWGEVGGTQFTGYMAMMNLSAIIGYQLTGPLAERFDYPTLFLIGAALQTLVILAVLWIDPDQTRRELESPGPVEAPAPIPMTA
ncbi:MAG: MFS transporter [Candidatus Thermoplasmatota archaeon]|nr:MFS transporter [Candidatus Thermoplasmatota archaeon]MEC8742240.1 MFS transporter [Candidatus Thermoplasmatota archaeon]MEC8779586.1 MFS transporter [Candidatus Thermoplasmatota archaeon]